MVVETETKAFVVFAFVEFFTLSVLAVDEEVVFLISEIEVIFVVSAEISVEVSVVSGFSSDSTSTLT